MDTAETEFANSVSAPEGVSLRRRGGASDFSPIPRRRKDTISEWQDEWYYRPSGATSAKSQAAIVSTEGEMLDWWMRSQGFQYVEYK